SRHVARDGEARPASARCRQGSRLALAYTQRSLYDQPTAPAVAGARVQRRRPTIGESRMSAATTIPTERIRNVVILGHGGTGKTTLAEALIGLGGRDVSRGGLLDNEPEERERGHSLSLGVGWFEWRGHRINLLDAPGADDAIGDAYPALL